MLHLDTSSLLVLCLICTFLTQSCINAKCKNSYQKVGVYLFIYLYERHGDFIGILSLSCV